MGLSMVRPAISRDSLAFSPSNSMMERMEKLEFFAPKWSRMTLTFAFLILLLVSASIS